MSTAAARVVIWALYLRVHMVNLAGLVSDPPAPLQHGGLAILRWGGPKVRAAGGLEYVFFIAGE